MSIDLSRRPILVCATWRSRLESSHTANVFPSWSGSLYEPALFVKVRRESVQTQSETGTRRRETLRHTRAVYRRAERRDCPSQPHIRTCSRSLMNNAG